MPPCPRLLLVTAVVLSATPLLAQQADTTGPKRGTWGAEASVGGSINANAGQSASLLRYVSPRVAFVGGLSYARLSTEQSLPLTDGFSNFTSAYSTLSLQAGVRRYGGAGIGLRPVVGGGLLVARQAFGGDNTTNAGGYAEAGAAWFFNPHVSLGVLGGVSALKRDGGWSVGATLARLTGAVYF